MKEFKKVISILLIGVFVIFSSNSVFAANQITDKKDKAFVIVNGQEIVYEGENYDNPNTGEYIHWTGERSADKNFTFKIRYSVQSSKFTVHSSKVLIKSNAHIENVHGNVLSGYNGHLYQVTIDGFYSRALQFSVGSSQSGTIKGLKKGGSYRVTIINNDYLDGSKYLVGSGSVSPL
ncbi:hypothetical protein [Finegoldia magna]|uniref:hypothetical protein n=1 Tax=Finegoldia magna TaxID=1260 RepID=UPI00290AB4C0|nr:hypothetical protein [Finegoldia magna]MDU7166171.1 hypothetical protein [Finegoldia magna]